MGNSTEKELKKTEIIKNICMEGRLKLMIIDGKELLAPTCQKSQLVNVVLYRSKLRVIFDTEESRELDMVKQVTILKYNRDSFTFVLAVTLTEMFEIWNISTDSIKSFLNWKYALFISKRPPWIYSPVCQLCTVEFSTFTRTHHCRYCGGAVCDPCSRLEAKIEILGYSEPQRICSLCAKTLPNLNRSIITTYRRSETQANLKNAEFVLDIIGGDVHDENQGSI